MTNKELQSRYQKAFISMAKSSEIVESHSNACIKCSGTMHIVKVSSTSFQGVCCDCGSSTIISTRRKITNFIIDCYNYNNRIK